MLYVLKRRLARYNVDGVLQNANVKCMSDIPYCFPFNVFHVHSYQDQFIQPGWAECVFLLFSLGLHFFVRFCVPILLCLPGHLSHLS